MVVPLSGDTTGGRSATTTPPRSSGGCGPRSARSPTCSAAPRLRHEPRSRGAAGAAAPRAARGPRVGAPGEARPRRVRRAHRRCALGPARPTVDRRVAARNDGACRAAAGPRGWRASGSRSTTRGRKPGSGTSWSSSGARCAGCDIPVRQRRVVRAADLRDVVWEIVAPRKDLEFLRGELLGEFGCEGIPRPPDGFIPPTVKDLGAAAVYWRPGLGCGSPSGKKRSQRRDKGVTTGSPPSRANGHVRIRKCPFSRSLD